VAEQGRNGLRRSKGFKELLKVTDLEMTVLRVITRSPRDPTYISKSSKIDLSRTKRMLTSLEKKGLIVKVRKEANLDQYCLLGDLKLPRKPWTRDHGFEPEYLSGIEEKVMEPLVSVNDAAKMLQKISVDVEIREQDLVRYPFYLAKIRGEGRIRYIAIDGIGGRYDRELSNVAKELLNKLK
jgi:predicted transcriptional regulator